MNDKNVDSQSESFKELEQLKQQTTELQRVLILNRQLLRLGNIIIIIVIILGVNES